MKKYKIIFWLTTGLIFLTQGVMELLTGNSEMAREAIVTTLGYPAYFLPTLVAFKVAGALALILPWTPSMLREWAYAGFAFDFIFAAISVWVVMEPSAVLFPVIALIVLGLSRWSYQRMHAPAVTPTV